MATAQISKQKYDIISWVTRLENRKLIRELHYLATSQEEVVHLSDAQMAMLQMSDEDIKNGRLVSEEELTEQDKKWIY
jgi:hypothetical protein